MINCLIVEDNKMAQKALERHCQKMENLNLIDSCSTIDDALEVLENNTVDLIFLDIELGDSKGFEVLDNSPVIPNVIVISSEEKYAFEAFKYDVDNYLKKPISFPDFKVAVEKVTSTMDVNKNGAAQTNNIFIKSHGRYINLSLDDIYYIENIGDYVKFHLEKESHLVHGTIKGFAGKLPRDKFLKVHRSYIVNLAKIVDLEENSLLVGRQLIPVSRANKKELMNKLNLI